MVGPRATCGSPPLNSMRISRRIRSTTSSGVARLRNSGYRSNRVISSWSCDRLKISWLIVCSLVSSSLVTEDLTNVSETSGRSTSRVAVER